MAVIRPTGPGQIDAVGDANFLITSGLFIGQPPEFTARVRGVLGPDKMLVVGMSLAEDAAEHPATVAEGVRAHRASGADHVVLLPSLASRRPPPTVEQLVALAAHLSASS